MKKILWIIAAIIILLAGMWSRTKVIAYNQMEDKKHYYELQEAEAIAQMRRVLQKEGYSYSGITMTKRMPDAQTRQYQVSIHHQAFSHADETEKKAICGRLEELSFAGAGEDLVTFEFFLEE